MHFSGDKKKHSQETTNAFEAKKKKTPKNKKKTKNNPKNNINNNNNNNNNKNKAKKEKIQNKPTKNKMAFVFLIFIRGKFRWQFSIITVHS